VVALARFLEAADGWVMQGFWILDFGFLVSGFSPRWRGLRFLIFNS
jgi:hypothetical protein